MKVFIIFAVVALAAGGALALTQEQLEKAENTVKGCAKEHNISDEQITKIKQGDFANNDPKIMCFANCFLEKVGFFTDGILHEDVIIEKLTKDGRDKDEVKKFLDACKDKKGANNCETAFELYKCYTEQKTAHVA